MLKSLSSIVAVKNIISSDSSPTAFYAGSSDKYGKPVLPKMYPESGDFHEVLHHPKIRNSVLTSSIYLLALGRLNMFAYLDNKTGRLHIISYHLV